MIKNKFSYKELFKYIFLFIISFFCMAFIQTTKSYAGNVNDGKIESVSGINKSSVTRTTTCTSWRKGGGPSCTVTVKGRRGAGDVCPSEATITFTFSNNGVQSKTMTQRADPNKCPTSSCYCSFSASVSVYAFDVEPPFPSSYTIKLTPASGTVCTSYTVQKGGSVTCTGPVTATGSYQDNDSGVSSSSFSKTCSPGTTCRIDANDKVGNDNRSLSLVAWNAPLYFNLNKDTQKCSRTTGSIYSGTQYNGWYVGTAKCSARCTSDNLAVGGTGYGSTNTDKCYAQACDKAGNCTSVLVKIPRDYNPPTCSQQSITSDALINNYRMGTVTVSWKCSDSQSGCKQGTYSQSPLNNHATSLNQTFSDKAGNIKGCPAFTCQRDTRAPSGCNFSLSDFSNSFIILMV